MDAINIILEFESDLEDKENIYKDIWSIERNFVDFNIIIKCPDELEKQKAGLNEKSAISLVRKLRANFDLNKETIREDIKNFIHENKSKDMFLNKSPDYVNDIESMVDSIIAYKKYNYPNWLEFKRDKWSVSQNAFVFGKKRRTKTGGFYFVCGGIPENWLIALSKKWPNVLFEVYARMEFSNREGMVSLYHVKNGIFKRKKDVKRKF